MAAGRSSGVRRSGGGSRQGRPAGRQGGRGASRGPSAARAGSRGGHAPRRGSHRPRASSASAELTGDVIYGRRSVAEALEAGLALRQAFVAESSRGHDATIARLLAQLEEAGVPVHEVPKATLDHLSYHGNHQGVLVEAKPFAYSELADLIEASGEGPALVVVLDHVQDEGNLGAIARSAECVGATGLVIANRRAAGAGPGAYKASAGALARLPIAQVPNVASAVEELKRAGFWALCATEHADETLFEADLSGRICLVVGAEDTGVSRLVRERSDEACALPIVGSIESLNVAQSATVFCYEWLRHVLAEGPEG